MTDIKRIISLIDEYIETTGRNRVEANEISLYLEKNGVLSHSTKGQPLRKLLREGKIPNAEQPGGKGTSWYILHSGIKKTITTKTRFQKELIKVESPKKEQLPISIGFAPIEDSELSIIQI